MRVFAKITGIEYKPLLCRTLKEYSLDNIGDAICKDATFIVNIDNKNKVALSWWVSAKRTRSYPYARVYDSLGFAGKKITIIPILKDEGKGGDRDFLQWDTISLMSLLGVYVIIAYYDTAKKSSRYEDKITEQRFDIEQIKKDILKLMSYQSDALHWNIEQIDRVGELGKKALESYANISKQVGVEMHSKSSAEKRISELIKGKEVFMKLSRELAQKAQNRESLTIQPKEKVNGTKGILTITNYLGGNYFFTSDEIELEDNSISLIEAKHTMRDRLPSLEDIKDGLIKMILFTNLKEVKVEEKGYKTKAILKLTTSDNFDIKNLIKNNEKTLELLKKEAKQNNFQIKLNLKLFE